MSLILNYLLYLIVPGESIWSNSLGPVAQALKTDIPEPQMVSTCYTTCIGLLTSAKEHGLTRIIVLSTVFHYLYKRLMFVSVFQWIIHRLKRRKS